MSSGFDQSANLPLELVANSNLTGYFAVAFLAILIYDHLDCFPEEVELMWKSRFGLAKVIYLWNRYFSLIAISLIANDTLREITTDIAYIWHSSFFFHSDPSAVVLSPSRFSV
ncbi:hypothetical protein B0H15DRAFT_517991 [Mycena belliarum]|uniref:DUF6533 domain-containing protein n=1 Tax=Mycena belliarum TaxID=1033014 RepID=A0AAD6TU07_9AGAR|nr:hypothetical protein B0H15DRAFT_517991 [Mycena belliae]